MAKRAVVIGVNEYQDKEKILPLKGAENDAREVCASLRDYGGFTILHCLTGPDASFANIRQAMSDLFWKTGETELDLFYFSGHGFQDGYGEGYIAPCDIKYSEPFVRGIRTRELKNLFLASKCKKSLLILDCCHSGVATEDHKGVLAPDQSFVAKLEPSKEEAQALAQAQAQDEDQGTGKFILASSRGDQNSREKRFFHEIRSENEDEHFHGIFSFHLLEGLNGQAAGQDNRVTLGALHAYLKEQMKDVKEQERTFWGSGAGPVEDTVLVEACRLRDLEALFEQAAEHLKTPGAESLFYAIKCLVDAVRGFPGSKKADPLTREINKRLLECAAAINAWRVKNPDMRLQLCKYREFLILEGLATEDLSFTVVAKESLARRNLFLELVQVSQGNLGFKVLRGDLSREETSVALPPQPLKQGGKA